MFRKIPDRKIPGIFYCSILYFAVQSFAGQQRKIVFRSLPSRIRNERYGERETCRDAKKRSKMTRTLAVHIADHLFAFLLFPLRSMIFHSVITIDQSLGLSTMDGKSFSTTVEVPQSPKDVFSRIADVPQWWIKGPDEAGGVPTEFEGESTKLNDEFILRHGEVHYSKQKIVELVPGKKLAWLVTDSRLTWIKKDIFEWTATRMIFDLTPRGKNTLLAFTHQGLIPEKECYTHCVEFWERILRKWIFDL